MATAESSSLQKLLVSQVAGLSLTSPPRAELVGLPTEIQIGIIKQVLPVTVKPSQYMRPLERIVRDEMVTMESAGQRPEEDNLKLDAHAFFPNETGIPAGGLNIARASRHFYGITVEVLYGNRCFEIEMNTPALLFEDVEHPS